MWDRVSQWVFFHKIDAHPFPGKRDAHLRERRAVSVVQDLIRREVRHRDLPCEQARDLCRIYAVLHSRDHEHRAAVAPSGVSGELRYGILGHRDPFDVRVAVVFREVREDVGEHTAEAEHLLDVLIENAVFGPVEQLPADL